MKEKELVTERSPLPSIPPFDLARAFPAVATVEISYLQQTPGDGYPSSSYSWNPAKGDRLECSNGACLKGGLRVDLLMGPIVAAGQTKAVRKQPCSGQERMTGGGFRPCTNVFMLAVAIGYKTL